MFFFIPHTQMFNILVPIATYWMTTESLKEDFFLKKNTYWIIAAVGLGLLCYGTFIIPAVIFGVISVVTAYKNSKTQLLKTLFFLMIYVVIFSVPFVLWSTYVISLKGKIYFHEAESCHQFVWIKDMIFKEGMIPTAKKYLELLWQTQISGAEFLPITFALLLISYALCNKDIFLKHLKTGAFLSLINWLFIGGMGFYPWRLVFTMHLPLWIASSMSLNTLKNVKKEFVLAMYFLILAYGAYIAIMPAAF